MGSMRASVALGGAVVAQRQKVKAYCRGLGAAGTPACCRSFSWRGRSREDPDCSRKREGAQTGLVPEVGCGPQEQCWEGWGSGWDVAAGYAGAWLRLEPGVALDEPGGPLLQSSDGLEARGRPGHS